MKEHWTENQFLSLQEPQAVVIEYYHSFTTYLAYIASTDAASFQRGGFSYIQYFVDFKYSPIFPDDGSRDGFATGLMSYINGQVNSGHNQHFLI